MRADSVALRRTDWTAGRAHPHLTARGDRGEPRVLVFPRHGSAGPRLARLRRESASLPVAGQAGTPCTVVFRRARKPGNSRVCYSNVVLRHPCRRRACCSPPLYDAAPGGSCDVSEVPLLMTMRASACDDGATPRFRTSCRSHRARARSTSRSRCPSRLWLVNGAPRSAAHLSFRYDPRRSSVCSVPPTPSIRVGVAPSAVPAWSFWLYCGNYRAARCFDLDFFERRSRSRTTDHDRHGGRRSRAVHAHDGLVFAGGVPVSDHP